MNHMRRYSVCRTEASTGKKCLTVTSGSPLPCHVILNFPPLCFCLCCWRVQWKMPESVEQMPLFFPDHGARGFWAGGLGSCFEATINLVAIAQHFGVLVPPQYDAPSVIESAHSKWRIPVRSAVPCSCWAHTRKEGRGDWLTGKENQGRELLAMETSDLQACVQVCDKREKSKGMIVFFFSLIAQLGFSNVLLWNRNIEGIDQLSCTPCLCDIAGVLCNKGRKWKQTKKKKSPPVR